MEHNLQPTPLQATPHGQFAISCKRWPKFNSLVVEADARSSEARGSHTGIPAATAIAGRFGSSAYACTSKGRLGSGTIPPNNSLQS